MRPRVICISGPDGVGKTTQARMLVDEFKSNGVRTKYVWLRFSHVLILPLLALIKITGRSRMDTLADGTKTGSHDLRGSRLLREIFFMFTFADLWLAHSLRVALPRRMGTSIIMDRNAIDAAVDISISAHDNEYWKSSSGQLLLGMATRNIVNVVLVCDENELKERRMDVSVDSSLHDKLSIYSEIARYVGVLCIDASGMTEDLTHATILRALQEEMET